MIKDSVKTIQLEHILKDIKSCLHETNLALEDENKGYPYAYGYMRQVITEIQFQIHQMLEISK